MALERNNSFLNRMAVAARLAVKEFHRFKIRRVDLAKADLRLGQKAYATGTAEGQVELVSRLDGVAQRLTELRQQRIEAASTLGEKAKVLASRIGKAIQIGAVKLRRLTDSSVLSILARTRALAPSGVENRRCLRCHHVGQHLTKGSGQHLADNPAQLCIIATDVRLVRRFCPQQSFTPDRGRRRRQCWSHFVSQCRAEPPDNRQGHSEADAFQNRSAAAFCCQAFNR